MSSADRVSLFSSKSPSLLAIWSLFLNILVGAYGHMLQRLGCADYSMVKMVDKNL